VWTNAEGTKELAATANQRQRHFAQHIEFSSDDVKLLLRATSVLSVLGLPALQSLDRAGLAQLTALKRHWRLVGAGDASASANVGAIERVSLFERFYRTVDRRLFGRGVWVLAGPGADGLQNDGSAGPAPWCLAWRRNVPRQGHTDCLCVEYEGLPMEALEQAVRQRIGHPGGMVCARVWRLQAAQPPRLLITAWLRLDHRSLHRSVVLCAVKLPMLLNAAWTRRDRPMDAAPLLDAHAPAALSAGRQLWRLARTSLTWLLWREQWQIEVGRFDGDMPRPGETTAVMRPPSSAFWADPFLLRRGPRMWVLFEELPFRTQRGHISAVEIDGAGRMLSAPQVVLKEPWHLSYPFLWHEEGRVFMIPEGGRSRELSIYEAIGDGLQWERRATLISGCRLADATVARHEGRLWMFATCADDGVATMDDSLHIYFADRIEGPWVPHALNPVKIDARSSRPAGSMWVADGVLHRVVQDCSSTYGGRIQCMRVTRLTEDEFDEECVPGWAPTLEHKNPWHTFNSMNNLTVTDRLVRLPRWRSR